MKVNLTYFKHTGKYYSEGSYTTTNESLLGIWEEVRDMAFTTKTLPDLIEGHSEFIVSIDVPEHPHNHPKLLLPRHFPD